ncbi:MAG TPA: mobile mystery protein A, partial [Ignavibacteria bacterium]|nr:mobile mystery protein A [Ignavibacteria bacterium]
DRKFKRKVLMRDIEVPREGWIKEIRSAFKLTYAQLAKKLSITPSAIKKFETNEINGKINLKSLNKIADAMNCKLIYALVPHESLEKIIDDRIDYVAVNMISHIDYSMMLEKQSLNGKILKEQMDNLKSKLKNNFSSKIWNYDI